MKDKETVLKLLDFIGRDVETIKNIIRSNREDFVTEEGQLDVKGTPTVEVTSDVVNPVEEEHESKSKSKGKLSALITEEEPKQTSTFETGVVDSYKEGMTNTAIQEKYNISNGKLYSILRNHDVELRSGTTPTEKRINKIDKKIKEQIIGLYNIGVPTQVIMKEHGVNKNTLYTLLDMEGIARRR